jgi:hypothetical protein
MLKLTVTFLAGALTLASFPAVAFDLPDTGSKNFSPSDDTPTYFKNETAPVSARTADTTERDWSVVDEAAPTRSVAEPEPTAHPNTGRRHGRYALVRSSGRHAAFFKGYPARATRTVWVRNAAAPARAANNKPVWAASIRSAPANAAKTTSAKHGKSGARHA